ncbi:MAG: hypothetical protein ACLQVJ_26440 [Syntrophobacteraceae bacterium]
MSTDLDTKAKVALDLLDRGAEEVSIVGTDIKVIRRGRENLSHQAGGNIQIVNVDSRSSANPSINISASISIVRQEVERDFKEDERYPEILDKLKEIELELTKPTPDKAKTKGLLHWFLDLDWASFAKIIRIVLEKLPS